MKILNIIVGIITAIILTGSLMVPTFNSLTDNDSLDVVVITGQSNAAYRESYNYRVSPEVATANLGESPDLFYYGTATAPASYEVIGDPTYDTTFESYSIQKMCEGDSYVIGGLEAPLAITIHNKTGNDVLILNVAVSGAPIDWLSPTGSWGAFASGVIEHALADVSGQYDKINKIGWICLQGEADTSTAIDTYKTKFMRMADYLGSMGFDTGYIVPSRTTLGGNSVIAQKELAEEYSNIHIVADGLADTFTTANGLLYSDAIHYTELGRIKIGIEAANNMELPAKSAISTVEPIINIIPIVVIVAILMLAVGAIAYRRAD